MSNAIAFVMTNKQSGELFLAYPMYFRFSDEETIDKFKVGIFFEEDKPAAYAVEYMDELMMVNSKMFEKKIADGTVEKLGEL